MTAVFRFLAGAALVLVAAAPARAAWSGFARNLETGEVGKAVFKKPRSSQRGRRIWRNRVEGFIELRAPGPNRLPGAVRSL
jgi:hypothetical protein